MTAREIEEKLLKENPNATMADLLRVLPDEARAELQDVLKDILMRNLMGSKEENRHL